MRASVLLSASSILLTVMILLVNYRLQIRKGQPFDLLDIAFEAAAVLTIVLIFTCVTNCISAIATRKTTRSLHRGEIPPRFLFNWGDTLRSIDGYTSFADTVTSLDREAILGHAIAELWTDIMQHARRHKYLRTGINLFRYSLMSFIALSALALSAIS